MASGSPKYRSPSPNEVAQRGEEASFQRGVFFSKVNAGGLVPRGSLSDASIVMTRYGQTFHKNYFLTTRKE